jgi:hypothetical protein
VLADGLEQLTDKALRRPIREADLAAAPADANHLGSRAILIGREHDTEGGDDDVEASIGERQSFRIGFTELDVEPVGVGAFTGALA